MSYSVWIPPHNNGKPKRLTMPESSNTPATPMTFPFGKYKGKPVSHAETDYLCWLYSQAWFRDGYPKLLWPVAKTLMRRLESVRPSPPWGPHSRVIQAAEFVAMPDGDLV